MEHAFTTSDHHLLVLSEPPEPEHVPRLLAHPPHRRHVFFDQRLHVVFVLQIPCPDPVATDVPPADLLRLLLCLQVVLEASYVSPQPIHHDHTPRPPKNNPALAPAHPSIFPPNTPFPLPEASQEDLPYVESRGTPLATHVWAVDHTPDSIKEAFALICDKEQNVWLAIYKFQSIVEFPSSGEPNPMLCYTVSATLRDKPLLDYPLRDKLQSDWSHLEKLSAVFDPAPLTISTKTAQHLLRAPPEANILSKITGGSDDPLYLPSSRLGPFTRQQAYSLAPVLHPDPSKTGTSTSRGNNPVIRRSFRRVLHTASGFHLRMLTMFVPYMIIPGVSEDEEMWIEAGSEERTVVLCVELDTRISEEFGFCVEDIIVKIAGESTPVRLVSWGGKSAFSSPEHVFPLDIRPREQYNILYAVSLTEQQGRADSLPEQRYISIAIKGKTFKLSEEGNSDYLTASYVSKWSCVLDLSGLQSGPLRGMTKPTTPDPLSHFEALPIPPSPFPLGPAPPYRSRPATLEIPAAEAIAGRSRSDKPLPPLDLRPIGSPPNSIESKRRSGPDSQTAEAFTWKPASGLPPRLRTDFLESSTPSLAPLRGVSILSLSPKTPKHDSRETPHSPSPLHRFSPGVPTVQEADESTFAKQQQREEGSIILTVELSHIQSGTEKNMVIAGGQFALDIFVFNETATTKRLEIGFGSGQSDVGMVDQSSRSILPLENRCQIGPLQPQTCQSLRVKFIALEPGVHKLDSLSILDLNTGHRVNLRSALDIVVLEDVRI